MAGHSKWANIQHRKGAQDKKRGKIFTRLIREITVATKMGGGPDPAMNPRLRLAIDKGLAANMPKDNIERAIKRGSGDVDGANYDEARYEGYGAGGVAVMVDCLTDNKNRTVAEVRHAFSKFGGNLGADGSVGYLFTKAGVLTYAPGEDEDALMDAALEAGADDVLSNDDGSIEVITTPEDFSTVLNELKGNGLEPADAEVTERPATMAPVSEKEAETLSKMLDMLEELDDVQDVYSNVEYPQAS